VGEIYETVKYFLFKLITIIIMATGKLMQLWKVGNLGGKEGNGRRKRKSGAISPTHHLMIDDR